MRCYGRPVPGLRLLLRFAPMLVGAVAAAVWLRRRRQERAALMAPPPPPAIEPPRPEDPHPGARDPEQRRRSSGRFEREPIDIVTVVDDLLLAGR